MFGLLATSHQPAWEGGRESYTHTERDLRENVPLAGSKGSKRPPLPHLKQGSSRMITMTETIGLNKKVLAEYSVRFKGKVSIYLSIYLSNVTYSS